MNHENLFWKIFNAEDESGLAKIVELDSILSNPLNWRPYGDQENNFSTFENQMSKSPPALVEKITNSIDALLIKNCIQNGESPTSPEAPRSMQEAVEKYYGVKSGDFSIDSDTARRRTIGEDIQLIAVGDKTSPNLMLYDNGEGQAPDEFPNTFLSLQRGNKTSIQFVQGKYNMGSTGAVVFCGTKHRFQLIASKRQNSLVNDPSNNDFGFTLVRRHPLSESEQLTRRASWYEYLVIDGTIPRFAISELDLGLFNRKFEQGSIVKMYSYQLPRGIRSNVTLDLWRELNQLLYQPALPFIVYESRDYRGNTPTKPVLGNRTRISVDDRDKKEQTISFEVESEEMGLVKGEATVFKMGVEKKEFVGERAVVFSLNGQVQGTLQRKFISQDLGFQMLRDSLLIHIDCTNIKTDFRQDLFMASRDRLKEGGSTEILIEKISEILRSNETLKKLNQERKSQILKGASVDKEVISKILEKIPLDKDLLNLLKKNGDLAFLKRFGGGTKQSEQKKSEEAAQRKISKRFPSIFKIDLKDDANGKKIKGIPLNGRGSISFETDVEDEYFFRPLDGGELQLQILGWGNNGGGGHITPKPNTVKEVLDVTKEGPSNNAIRLTFQPKANVNVGDEIELSAKLTSPSGDLEAAFWVKIVEPQKEAQPKKKEEDFPSLPQLIRVYERANSDGNTDQLDDVVLWDKFNWTGNDIVKVYNSSESGPDSLVVDAIAVNMDSFALRRFITSNRLNTPAQLRQARDEYALKVYLHSLFLYGIYEKLGKEDAFRMDSDSDEFIGELMKSYSSFLISIDSNETIYNALKDE